MNRQITRDEIEAMTVEERLALLEDVWDSLSADQVPVPDWHSDELERRVARHSSDPARTEDWEDVKRSVLEGLRR